MKTAVLSVACCTMKVAVVVMLFAIVFTNGVYVQDRRRELLRDGSSESSERRGTQDESMQPELDQNSAESEITSPKRKPFQRTLVLCNRDDECEDKSFCHGGEGHKSCLPCRRSRRRCQRNGMCCYGNVCRQGRCVPKEMRYDSSYAKAIPSESEEESISQHTRDNMRKLREDEVCEATEQCAQGLCCAQHFWTRICKPILVEGDVCTKKRDRLTAVFQRCQCGESLSCKRHPSKEIRYHTCQLIKTRKRPAKEDDEDGDNENEEPALRIEVQLANDGVQHDWNEETDNSKSHGPDPEKVDYRSEDQSVSENHWGGDEDQTEEEQTEESVSELIVAARNQTGSIQPVTNIIEVL
ncbi:uncharacterized protein LOC119732602 [Patiria miniata]|uniref:Uncharacterized protein n=1 Tax=Patiria miniata TaxID=46514 RepID=A0A914AE85_PATMI|nr:uncharacterized protein LOC119732602 [Patiria miniata]